MKSDFYTIRHTAKYERRYEEEDRCPDYEDEEEE